MLRETCAKRSAGGHRILMHSRCRHASIVLRVIRVQICVCVSPTIITPLATSICSMWTIQCSTVDASIVCCRPSGWMFFLIQQGGSPLTALPTPHRGFPEVTRGLRLKIHLEIARRATARQADFHSHPCRVPTSRFVWCPQGDSNARTRLRRPVLYPLSYGGRHAAHALVRTPSVSHGLPRHKDDAAGAMLSWSGGLE